MSTRKIRYAVIGLGDISQTAVLPAFDACKESELGALVSGDAEKLKSLGKKYKVSRTYRYDQLEECLMTGDVDAVYVATPNHLHREYVERAVRKGVAALCEKPMAPSEEDCHAMMAAARENNVPLMIAYRLHFERSTLEAIDIAQSGKIGELRMFSSIFSQQLAPGNVRSEVDPARGGGSVWDMGVYCINAARYLFGAEPFEVTAFSANGNHKRFAGIDEMTGAVLRFPGDRIATFTSSFGAASTSTITLVGTEGRLEIEPAYDYTKPLEHRLTVGGKTSTKTYPETGQFPAEIDYFSQCILSRTEPEPSGEEGLADVRVIEAVYRSAMSGSPVGLDTFERKHRPTLEQEITRKQEVEKEKVHAASPSVGD